ncbi:50S ribosomal protein L24 [Demequina lignilytica]|uniref:Large ribosomal subunit protein uL24 n=1 Tax=Demequina lignilytica TaxID=3051663 RepID=A0AAW7M1R2_9MICO|nr:MULTISPECIES: 50S ribosomal protein L24 [unclassified Demequina]MDN4478116.1 50S ribosomal protein L24 [Demequina sp. SYSU T00039-1]MDN4482805.1 50S ribosomal protein L24 [Demequina sp. SYSU T0a273]MDN4488434.1 50S ribosomal protein L24 [Demequina sp. SYSU T00039]MDN4490019.1 50S ribosomal protein L24 [Demequina sp. SYSU T00068]
MAKIKKGDLVVVIAGRDRGQQGRVLTVDTERERVVVEGIQRVTKHIKPGTRRDNAEGGLVTVEAPIHISNVMLVDPETKKGTRVGYRTEQVEQDGRTRTKRVRVAKRSGKDV